MDVRCELAERERTPSVVVRRRCSVAELPGVIGEGYGRVMAYLGSCGHSPAGPPYVGYHNDDMQDLEVEIGFPTSEDIPGEGEVEHGEIPAGRYASTLHTGPYAEFAQAYNRLTAWIQQEGHEAAGPAYEIYLNDPEDTPEEALQTLVLFPLRG